MNTKYQHTLRYINKRCESAYEQGYKSACKYHKKSFAKGFSIGAVAVAVFSLLVN